MQQNHHTPEPIKHLENSTDNQMEEIDIDEEAIKTNDRAIENCSTFEHNEGHVCTECHLTFSISESLKDHIQNVHSDLEQSEVSLSESCQDTQKTNAKDNISEIEKEDYIPAAKYPRLSVPLEKIGEWREKRKVCIL